MPRPRKPVGTRKIDRETLIFLHVPNEIYDKLVEIGKPDKIVLDIIVNHFKK
ncbi:hypothetical protein D3C74_212500 [compost metagenome]